jgi:hypothetical protein
MFLNKYTAVVLVLIVLLAVYFVFFKNKKEGATGKNKKGSKKNNSKKKKEKLKSGESKDDDSGGDNNGDDDNGDDNDDTSDKKTSKDIQEDAKELYGIVHEGLARGMKKEEFDDLAGDLADNFTFIELKQLYNQCIDKKMDPLKAITLQDYIRILKKENSSS